LGESQLGHALNLALVSETLHAFAAEYAAGGPSRRYVLAENALVEESAVLADAPLVMRLIQRYRRLVVVELPLTATRIIVSGSVRVLGLGPGAARTARVHARANGSVRREVTARRTIAEIRRRTGFAPEPEARIPAILQVGPNWLVEEQIDGRHVAEPEMRRFAATCLPAFYRHTARHRPYRGPEPLAELEAEAARCVPGFALRGPPRLWPVALCKSDFNPMNILLTPDGQFWMIDWEFANVGPIAADLATVCLSAPSSVDVALGLLRDFSSTGCHAPEVQLTLGLAIESLRTARGQAATRRERRGGGAIADAQEGRWQARRTWIEDLMRAVARG
jgi:hypothetical protein